MAVELSAPARAEQTRARYPDESGYVERDGVRLYYEVYGSGEPTRPPAPDLVDHPLAPLEDADPVPGAPLPGAARSTGAATGARTGPRAGYARARVRGRRARGHGRDRHRAGDARLALAGRAAGAAARGRASRARRGGRLHLPVRAARRVAAGPHATPGTRSSTPTRAGRSTTATTGCGTTAASSSSSSRRCSPSRTRPSRSRTASAGGSRRRPRRSSPRSSSDELDARRQRASWPARVSCPVLVIQGTDDAITGPSRGIALAEATGGGAGRCSRARATARTSATRSRSTCCCATSSLPPRAARRAGCAGSSRRKRALYISSPIGLGHARARRGDRRRAAPHAPRPRDRLARPAPGHRACCEARGERIHPASALAGERVRPHRERVGRARPALLPGDPPDGRDPARQLHGLPRPRARRATTTCGSATRRGSSTTTCTRTRSRSAPRTCG